MRFASSTERLTTPGRSARQLSLTLGLPPLVGLVRCPAFDLPCVCPLPATLPPPSANRRSSAGQSRSVLVVLHDLDGLLHTPSRCRLPEFTRQMATVSWSWHRKAPPAEAVVRLPQTSKLFCGLRPWGLRSWACCIPLPNRVRCVSGGRCPASG